MDRAPAFSLKQIETRQTEISSRWSNWQNFKLNYLVYALLSLCS